MSCEQRPPTISFRASPEDDATVAVNKADDVLRIGALEPTFEAELAARYEIRTASRRSPDGPNSWPSMRTNFAWR